MAIVLCFCLDAAGVVGGLGYFGYRQERSDAVATVREYLEDISWGRYPAAYDRLCAKAKSGVSREDYAQRFPPPRITGFEIGDVSLADRDGESGYDVEVELRFEDGRTRTETYFVFSTLRDLDSFWICP